MKKFRERQNKGVKPIPHGIPFWFETRRSLELFFESIFNHQVARNKTKSQDHYDTDIKHSVDILDEINNAQSELSYLNDTEKSRVVKSRLGQGIFRELLLDFWSQKCAASNLDLPALLRASHIKPWRDCDNSDRLNVFNGLLLAPHYDLAFDKGYISFSDTKGMIVSTKLPQEVALKLHISTDLRLQKLEGEHLPFLQHHRENVFLK